MLYKPSLIKQVFHTARRFIAKRHLSSKKAIQIAITGSQGKTNTTYIITSILSKLGETVVTDTSLDTIYNVPITALKVKNSTKYLIWELGIDRPNEMSYHLEIARPFIGVITGISAVHTDAEHLGSLENLIAEKRKLIEAVPTGGFSVLNWDDPNVAGMAPYTKGTILKFGSNKDTCDVWVDAQEVISTLEGITFTLHDTKDNKDILVTSGMIGLQHRYNIMTAYLIYKIVISDNKPLTDEQISTFKEIVAELKPLPGRMSVEKGPRNSVLINDALRANPTSTRFGLQTLAGLQTGTHKKLAVLAEMGELSKAEEEHTKLGEFIATIPVDFVICIGPLQKYTFEAAKKSGFPVQNIFWANDVQEAAKIIIPLVAEGDVLYLKGSLHKHVERVLEYL